MKAAEGFDHDSRMEDGWIILVDRPGNGIQFNQRKLAPRRAAHHSPPAAPSPLGRCDAGLHIGAKGESEEVGQG